MNNLGHEAYRQQLQEIAAEYESRGYDVLVEPSPEELPEFLTGFHPDLVARGPNESVVVEVKEGTKAISRNESPASGCFSGVNENVPFG